MPRLKIDDIEYNTEELTERGLAILRSLQFVQSELNKLDSEMAICRIAQQTYIANLKAEIEVGGIEPVDTKNGNDE